MLPALAALPPDLLDAALRDLDEEDAAALADAEAKTWENWARPEQLEPDEPYRYLVAIAGRGGGKTWKGSNWVNRKADLHPGCRIALIGATKGDVRDIMIEDPGSGILATAPPWNKARFQPSLRRVTWDNGSVAIVYSADEPEQTRGLNGSFAWADELAKWKSAPKRDARGRAGDPNKVEAWDNLVLGIRIEPAAGVQPQILVSTTPRRVGRGAELVKDLTLGKKVNGKRSFVPPAGDPARWSPRPGVIVDRWSTDRNTVNLAQSFLADLSDTYAGTELERQERGGELLDAADGALWQAEWLEREGVRVPALPGPPVKIFVSVDPSHSDEGSRDGAGIIAVASSADLHAYLLEDGSMHSSPLAWAMASIAMYDRLRADAIVIEVTAVQTEKKGHVVKDTIRAAERMAREKDPSRRPIKWIEVHSGQDKSTRAYPVALLYEHVPPRVHHVMDAARPDLWAPLEDELVSWVPGMPSPNRMDAAVQGVTALLMGSERKPMELI